MLDEIEERVCHEGRSAFLPGERAAVLSRVLRGEFGFIGDAEAYDAPVNADFIRVLDRKRGLRLRCRSSMSRWRAGRDGAPMCSTFRATSLFMWARRNRW
jgi:hypothetical protein